MIREPKLGAGDSLEADVCIIGSGPAGMTLALELDRLPLRVAILESGSFKAGSASDVLTRVDHGEGDFEPPNATRRRQVGGTSGMWNVRLAGFHAGARYLPLDEIDFETRDWLPDSGWPFTLAHLLPFYERANELCGAGPADYNVAHWASPASPDLADGAPGLRSIIETFGPGDRFTRTLASRIRASQNITLYPGVTVAALEKDPSNSSVSLARLGPRRAPERVIRARAFVLACGAIENARILLCSPTASGVALGDQEGLVGRYFMDHFRLSAGTLTLSSRRTFERAALYDTRTLGQSTVCAKLGLSEDLLRSRRLLNSAIRLLPQPPAAQLAAVRALKSIGADFRSGRVSRATFARAKDVPAGVSYILGTGAHLAIRQRRFPPNVDAPGWAGLPHIGRRFATFHLEQQVEQAPAAGNRVVLSSRVSPDGLPMAAVHNRWSEVDVSSITATHLELAARLREAGLGELELPAYEGGLPELATPSGAHHHMGTTRMHVSPRHGVVDENLRVHGFSNLYVAGASTFPTGGYANPTLTIVALSIRLADHLKSELGQSLAMDSGPLALGKE